jgi:hypothetical protein
MSDDLVKRYDLQQPTHHMGSAEMVCDTYGDWVLYRDYKALLDLSSVSLCDLHREYDKRGDRIEELEAKAMKASNAALLEKRRADEAEGKLSKSEALLAKAVEALDRIQDGSYGKLAAKARTTLAELKGRPRG